MTRTRGGRLAGLALALLVVAADGAPTWGVQSTDASSWRAQIPRAPQKDDRYRNLDPRFRRASNWTRFRFYLLSFSSLLSHEHPFVSLPIASPDIRTLRQNRVHTTVTWVGHSTLLIQLDGVNILTDPAWSSRVGPWSGTVGVRRFTPPGIAFEDLPSIDAVLISHDYYDHLDESTVRRLAHAFSPRFVVPLGIKAWLVDRGLMNVTELDWGDSITLNGIQILCTPAQHGSGRTLADNGQRLWASWVVIGSKRFYFGGDSGYASHLQLIGQVLGLFDLAALPIGSYTPGIVAKPVHMSPEEALQGWRDLRARRFIGIHWGTFELAQEPYDAPPRRIAAEAERLKVDSRWILVPKPGETLSW